MNRRNNIFIIVLLLTGLTGFHLNAQHTFSIVAVDSATGEVGSAGATCLDDNSFPGSGGAIIISDVLPGKGAVHTQSYWNETNQSNANRLLNEDKAATEIIDWLIQNDVQNSPGIRQYGAVTLGANVAAQGYTGQDCLDAKAHVTGDNYSIQGNILIETSVIDSMEGAFLRSEGLPLYERLMLTLQAANIAGADSRCLQEGVSSRSAFIRVAKKDDDPDNLWMDLNVPVTPFGVEPIDELQILFDDFKATTRTSSIMDEKVLMLSSNPLTGRLLLKRATGYLSEAEVHVLDLTGRLIEKSVWSGNAATFGKELHTGQSYFIIVKETSGSNIIFSEKIIVP